jgi:glycosyltransferase involved in cell wall biosynthesis
MAGSSDGSVLKVLQVFNRYRERGGEEKSAERIFQHLGDLCEIDRLWWDSRDWDLPEGPGKLGQLKRMFYNKDSARELRSRINDFRPDVLLCHNLYPVGSPAVYHEAIRAGLPVIQYVHNFRPFSVGGSLWTGTRVARESLHGEYFAEVIAGAWQDSVLKSALFAILLKQLHHSGLLTAVKRWVCISEFMRTKFLEAGLPEEEVIALRHSWDRQDEVPDCSDEGYYLFLSRLVPEKGVRVLVDAWRQVTKTMGRAAPRLLIGGTGSEERLIRQTAEAIPCVEYLGYVDGAKKRQLIRQCRAMLAPSVWWEPLGLVTYEAYDYAKPMLAAASGGLTETVQHEVTGLLYQENDASALAEAVIKFERLCPDKRISMGDAGREWLKRDADPARWKERFAEILHSLIRN